MKVGSRYAAGFAPYVAVLESIILPPRGRVGSYANHSRMMIVRAALHKAKYPKRKSCPNRDKDGGCFLCKIKVKRHA